MCGKRITEIIRGKRKALKSNDFKAFFRGDGGIRTHDLYTASTMLGILCSITWCYLLLLYIVEFLQAEIFVRIAHYLSAIIRQSMPCRQSVGSHQCHFDSLIIPSAVL